MSPTMQVVLEFDTLKLDDGLERPIGTVVKGGVPNVKRQVAGGTDNTDTKTDRASRATREITERASDAIASAKQQATDALALIKQPDKMSRLKDAVVARLPYHPQYLRFKASPMTPS